MFKIAVLYADINKEQFNGLIKVNDNQVQAFIYENSEFKVWPVHEDTIDEHEEFIQKVGEELVPEIT